MLSFLKAFTLAVIFLPLTQSLVHGSAKLEEPELRQELLSLVAEDQRLRSAKPADFTAIRATDDRNAARLKEILAKHGWPSVELIEEDGVRAAWLIAQHAVMDPDLQLKVLALIEPLARSGQFSFALYAYLYDRTHHPQRYGTQGTCVAGRWVPREIENSADVDARRLEAKIVPAKIADYAALVTERSCKR